MATARPGQVTEPPRGGSDRPVVLHVLEALEGGAARHLVDLTRLVGSVRHEVVVPAERVGGVTDPDAICAMTEAGAGIHLLAMTRNPVSIRNAKAVAGIRRIVLELRPSIVHGHSTIGGALGRLAACRTTAATVYTPHAPARHPAVTALERLLGRCTDRFVAVSASEAEWAVGKGFAPRERVRVIPNGIALEVPPDASVDLRAHLGLDEGAQLVGTVSRLVRQKRPEDFVQACALVSRRVPDAHFVLVGAGPRQRQLDREVGRTGLGRRFHQIAFLPNVAASLGQLDVFVLASRFEGGPYAPLEAMRAGTPVVLTDVVGNRDVVEHRVSGLLVPVADPDALAAAVAELLLDPELGASLASAGRTRVREEFDVVEQGRALSALYQQLARP